MGGGAGLPTNASGEVNRDTNVGAHDECHRDTATYVGYTIPVHGGTQYTGEEWGTWKPPEPTVIRLGSRRS